MSNQHQSARRLEDSGIKVGPAYPIIAMQIFTKTGTKFSQCGSMMGGRNDENNLQFSLLFIGEKHLISLESDQ